MIIEKIDIKCFGRLKNLTLEFADGVNVIEGHNESGKSTIAGFIKYMLYGFEATETEGTLSERRHRINWQSGIAEGSMNVSVKGKKYLVTRSTVMNEQQGRTTYKEESSIIDLESGTPAFGKLPAGEVFFGVDRELFENTAFVGQLGDASIKEGSVKESIENILFSGNERINIQRAASRISEKMESLYHQGNTGGAIYDLVKRQEELEERLHATDDANKQILQKEAELHEIKARKEEAEGKRERLLDLDECYRNVMLIQTFDKLHELEEQNEQISDAYAAFIEENTVSGFVPTRDYLTEIAVARRAVDDSYTRLCDAEEAYAKEKSAIGITKEIEGAIQTSDTLGGEDKIREILAESKKSKIYSIGGVIAGALAAIAAIVALIAMSPINPVLTVALIAVAVLALVGGGYLLYSYLTHRRNERKLAEKFGTETAEELLAKIAVIADARRKRDTMISNLENARMALERAKADSESARGELIRIAIRWGESPPLSGFDEYLDQLEHRVRLFLEKKEKLLDEKNNMEITVREIRRTLADKSEIDIRAQVPPLKRKVLSEINHEEIITGIAEAKSTIEEQQRLSWSVESELASLKLRATDPGELYSKIQALETKIDELRAKHKAYFVALRAINSASDNLRAEISPRLAEYATDMLKVMTDGKYSQLSVDNSLKINFTAEGDSEGRSVDYLSGGTRDLTYIALRLALVDMLYSEKPPICFDETFANQDNSRATAMMKAIGSLAQEGHQSFIFTCRDRERSLASSLTKDSRAYRLSAGE